jgi:hypothetical protein
MNTTMITPSANTALERYWEDYFTLPQSDAVLYPPAAAGVRLIRPAELETARADTPLARTMRVQATGLPHEAAVRMAIWNARGELTRMDGWDVADVCKISSSRTRTGRRSRGGAWTYYVPSTSPAANTASRLPSLFRRRARATGPNACD